MLFRKKSTFNIIKILLVLNQPNYVESNLPTLCDVHQLSFGTNSSKFCERKSSLKKLGKNVVEIDPRVHFNLSQPGVNQPFLCHQVYIELTGALRKAYRVKVESEFQLSERTKLGIVLLVKLNGAKEDLVNAHLSFTP